MMHEEDIKCIQDVKEILEKELRTEMKKIVDAGAFAPGQSKTLCEAVDLMFKMNDLDGWLENQGMSETSQRNMARSYGMENSYAQPRSYVTGRFTSRGVNGMNMMDPYSQNYMGPSYGMDMPNSYDARFSGHSTKDRMIAALESVMGDATNDYERRMVINAINDIQTGKSGK